MSHISEASGHLLLKRIIGCWLIDLFHVSTHAEQRVDLLLRRVERQITDVQRCALTQQLLLFRPRALDTWTSYYYFKQQELRDKCYLVAVISIRAEFLCAVDYKCHMCTCTYCRLVQMYNAR